MKHLDEIEAHSRRLPEPLQREVLDFVCFLEARYLREKSDTEDAHKPFSAKELERACGVLKAPHGLTLDDMEAVIRKRGGRL